MGLKFLYLGILLLDLFFWALLVPRSVAGISTLGIGWQVFLYVTLAALLFCDVRRYQRYQKETPWK